MSFFSSMKLVRPTKPPIVTAEALGRFVRDIDAMGVLVPDQEVSCDLKYGPRIDVDDQETEVRTQINDVIFSMGEIEWDTSDSCPSLFSLAEALLGNQKIIYRGYLNLGQLQDEIGNALYPTRP